MVQLNIVQHVQQELFSVHKCTKLKFTISKAIISKLKFDENLSCFFMAFNIFFERILYNAQCGWISALTSRRNGQMDNSLVVPNVSNQLQLYLHKWACVDGFTDQTGQCFGPKLSGARFLHDTFRVFRFLMFYLDFISQPLVSYLH